MRQTVTIAIDDIIPSTADILQAQGVPAGVSPDTQTQGILKQALSLYREQSQPVGILGGISKTDFETVYRGEGRNESRTPLAEIYPAAERLFLFAVTIGDNIGREINRLFETHDFPLGAMLDAVASEGTELAVDIITSYCRLLLKNEKSVDPLTALLPFSPGYCGWHLTAQKKLFVYLRPDEIDIELNESCLMQPLKSVSGVIVAGPKDIFEFEIDYPFCRECTTRSCRNRFIMLGQQQYRSQKQG